MSFQEILKRLYNWRSLKPFLSRVILTREEEDDDDDDDDDDDGEDVAWGRGKTRTFCSLKANGLKTGTKH